MEHPYPRLFTRANARLQQGLSLEAKHDVAFLACYVRLADTADQYWCWEDVLYLAHYGLVTTCPN